MIHRYWSGDDEPEWTGRALRSINRGVPVVDWDDSTLPQGCREWVREHEPLLPGNIRHRSNLIRLWLLNEYGGWWVDHDVTLLRPLAELPFPMTAAHETVCSCVMGFPSGHPMIQRAMANVGRFPTPNQSSVSISGERLLQRYKTPDVTLMELPYDAAGNWQPNSEPWAVHIFSTSSVVVDVK